MIYIEIMMRGNAIAGFVSLMIVNILKDQMIHIEIMMRGNAIAGFVCMIIMNTIARLDDLY